MASRWQENCRGWCQDCVSTCSSHFPGISIEESYTRLMTIGSVRYGVRVGAVSPPPPGAGPRYRSQCCWPASSHRDASSRVPLPPASSPTPINSLDIISCANRTEDAVAATSDQTPFVSVRDHVPYPGGCLLKKRCALVRPQVYSRLADYGDADATKEELATLDRLPRFRFGGNRSEKRGSEKFRELTERLKRSTAPIPPPRRHTRATPPPVGPETTATRAVPLPLRSASFSQVDYCPDDNKYIRKTHDPTDSHTTNTLPRPKNLLRARQDELCTSTPEAVVEDPSPEPPKDIPEVQVTSEPPEKTLVRAQDSANNNKDRRKDKLRRRKGIYLSQWPTEYYPNDVDENLIKYEEEDLSCTCEETAKVIQESLSEITKIHDSTSQIIGSSPQEEPLSPEDSSVSLEWPVPSTINNNNNNNNKIHSQSPDLKDSLKVSSGFRANSIFRSDSLSEGEPDNSERRSDQISLIPSDVSDCESRLSLGNDTSSPNIPRRYSKRPLRGPYGQMLEAEMKKPESRKNLTNDLKFLEDLSNKNRQTRVGGSCNSSIDETFMKESGLSSPKLPVSKRKVSADNLVVEAVEQKLVPNHQRTTSSPSKLEGFNNPEVSTELLEQLLRGSSEQLATKESNQQQALHNDTRTHVLIELYDNERIYVESLEITVVNYWEPLKKTENTLIEQNLVDEIFCQIPFLLSHHKNFLLKLKARLEQWDSRKTIGDIFLEMLTAADVIEHYVNYVNNWKRSRDIIKNSQSSRPQFARFLEAASKNNARKLTLDSLLIKPIQKFPKYELLLQRLIKHTSEDHPDYELLIKAEKEVHEQLLKINCTEKEALDIEQLREIESVIEGALELVSPERQYIRHDMIVMSHAGGPKKERALFLFTDLLLITGIKRRSGTINKKGGQNSSTTASNLDGNKYKLIMKVPLEDVEIIRSKDENLRQLQIEVDNLNEDIAVLSQITELSLTLHCNHSNLDDMVKEMLNNLTKNLQLQQNSDLQLCVLDLTVITQNGLEMVSIVFPKAEIRSSWEETLNDCKAKLVSGDRRSTPEMIATVPIRKTRAGLQFTCAAPTLSENGRDVWVCNSDGYVGQVCVLTLNEKPEPTVTSCNGVCNTRILCIASIPGPGIQNRASSFTSGKNRDKLQPQKAMQFDSSSSSDEDDRTEDDEKKAEHRDSESSSVHNEEPDKFSTMWLGTEDGCILIYNSNDNIRIKKNKIKLQLGSSVLCIIYLEHRVFASQANGLILMYERDGKGGWCTNNPKQIIVANSSCPVSKMVVCNSKILCASGNTVFIFNPQTFEKETSFIVPGNEPNRPPQNPPISCMFVSGNALWLSLQNSAIIKCYNTVTFEMVCETSVAPAVQKMLTSCDDIIRQHKAACLRVTALVHCKDLLWIGTSAGVLLTMPLPHVTPTTGKLTSIPPVTGVPHGHTGHVRILTSVEMPYPLPKKGTPKKSSKSKGSTEIPTVKSTKFLVISGGDGYEDFRTSNLSEVAGREDSTNHLLLWNI
ncbi:rho guanine nucleotide exchange factor 17-like isoform X3 [Rhynchophorus ferrugineus]|uniref:rho guanine nucleotide exchange factor 17-like isoform X3 n=1 Tax=Rhynchophorus ferrugineus TaxID=354439 RepID=UPI003FCDE2EF